MKKLGGVLLGVACGVSLFCGVEHLFYKETEKALLDLNWAVTYVLIAFIFNNKSNQK